MTKRILIGSLFLLMIAVLAGLLGYWLGKPSPAPNLPVDQNQPSSVTADQSEKKVLYWYDPMYPQQKFDKPGKSPFMDMELQPRYADESGNSAAVTIDPGITQNLGMRVSPVTRESLAQTLSASGALTYDERDVAVLQTRSGGFVERVYDLAPEDIVKKGAPLADLLVPEWAAVQEEYLALRALNEPALLAAARQRMRLAGMPQVLIEQVTRSGKASPVWTITSPIEGVLETLDIRQGMTLAGGALVARINGISSIWLEVAVPEAQISALSAGQPVQAHLPAYPSDVLNGTIKAILPQANPESRTVRVRVELPNPQQRLRPGMTAEVILSSDQYDALVIPAEAVIRTGKRAIVMLAENAGQYRPVEVRVGREIADKVEILQGLEEGQQVVASGQFLLDSEASLRGLTAQPLEPSASASKPALHEAEGTIIELGDDMITLSHGPFITLGMPGMTMGFPLADKSLAANLKTGDQVRFAVRQTDDGLLIERIERLGGQP
ncbi:CzcB family heavy metal RND efflux membrane fusion protein [Pseudomonas luteola]|uniref:CzcB family heavy metal RND efflux membrane fusion protein n=1 Tax=Pseudomonas luteola TaxID=47886 RepID=A0A2X2CH81_PSELU|nr:efflux RND transporter periplasmic adaptor subunit [Pseudomonas luteola]MBH3441498.1 efflux RND transporter periplasmic adaptor subunit [Pseudomonas luteola]SPZ05016.1 CzcB family heavy metal RND efflux membrane fusion protein [Pseudomonas luteola]